MNTPTPRKDESLIELLTVQQVADELQVHRTTVFRLRREGYLPTVRIAGTDRTVRIPRSAVEALLRSTDEG